MVEPFRHNLNKNYGISIKLFITYLVQYFLRAMEFDWRLVCIEYEVQGQPFANL